MELVNESMDEFGVAVAMVAVLDAKIMMKPEAIAIFIFEPMEIYFGLGMVLVSIMTMEGAASTSSSTLLNWICQEHIFSWDWQSFVCKIFWHCACSLLLVATFGSFCWVLEVGLAGSRMKQ